MRAGRRQQTGIGGDVAALIEPDDVNGLGRIELVDLALVRFYERRPLFVIDEEAMPEAVNLLQRFAVPRKILFGDQDRHRRSPRSEAENWQDRITLYQSPKNGEFQQLHRRRIIRAARIASAME